MTLNMNEGLVARERSHYIMTCETFIANFDAFLPHVERRPHGRYEQAIQYAIERIENIPHVQRIFQFGNEFPILLSEENMMAYFPRSVRQQSN